MKTPLYCKLAVALLAVANIAADCGGRGQNPPPAQDPDEQHAVACGRATTSDECKEEDGAVGSQENRYCVWNDAKTKAMTAFRKGPDGKQLQVSQVLTDEQKASMTGKPGLCFAFVNYVAVGDCSKAVTRDNCRAEDKIAGNTVSHFCAWHEVKADGTGTTTAFRQGPDGRHLQVPQTLTDEQKASIVGRPGLCVLFVGEPMETRTADGRTFTLPPAVFAELDALDTAPVPFSEDQVAKFPGLKNEGATCFFNGLMKALAADTSLDQVYQPRPADVPPYDVIRKESKMMMNFIRSGGLKGAHAHWSVPASGYLARRLFEVLRKDTAFATVKLGTSQEDTTEFAIKYLPALNAETFADAQILQVSETREILTKDAAGAPTGFGASYFSESGPTGGPLSIFEKTSMLYLPRQDMALKSFKDVQAAIDGYLVTETIDRTSYDNNKPPKPLGPKREAQKRLILTKVPRNLIIGLKVSGFNPANFEPFILNDIIDVNDEIKVPVYSVDQISKTSTLAETATFRRKAIVMHRGAVTPEELRTGGSGHYVAYVRGLDGWYLQDDSRPSHKVDDKDVKEAHDASGKLSNKIYLIIYAKTN